MIKLHINGEDGHVEVQVEGHRIDVLSELAHATGDILARLTSTANDKMRDSIYNAFMITMSEVFEQKTEEYKDDHD